MHDATSDWTNRVERLAYRQRLEVFLPSRDGGAALVSAALGGVVTLEAVVQAAADVAAYADEALQIVTEEYRPTLACRKACTYCCRKPGVLISVAELLRILDHVRQRFDEAQTAALRDRAHDYVVRVGDRNVNDGCVDSVPCPLLVDDLCSIYEVRPLVCRGYNSTDAEACRRAHANPELLVPMFAVLKDVTDGATVGMAQQLRDAGFTDTMVDLGTALHMALEAGGSADDAIVRGEQDLSRAERQAWVSDLWTLVSEMASRVGVAL